MWFFESNAFIGAVGVARRQGAPKPAQLRTGELSDAAGAAAVRRAVPTRKRAGGGWGFRKPSSDLPPAASPLHSNSYYLFPNRLWYVSLYSWVPGVMRVVAFLDEAFVKDRSSQLGDFVLTCPLHWLSNA